MAIDIKKIESTNIPKETYFFNQGDTHENVFYILRKGEIEVYRHSNLIEKVSSKNYVLGTISILIDQPRSAGLKTSQDSVVKKVKAESDEIYDWLIDSPEFLLTELRHLSSLLDDLNQENKKSFEGYRDLRNLFDPFLKPLTHLRPEIDDSTLTNSLEILLQARKRIVGETGKSNKSRVDLNLSEDYMRNFQTRDFVCEEGETGKELFILIEGSLSVLKEHQLVARIDKPGIIFGEMAGLTDGERKATVQAESESKVAVIPTDKLETYFEKSPSVATKITDMLLNRYENALNLNNDLETFQEAILKIYENKDRMKALEKAVKEVIRSLDDPLSSHEESQVEQLKDWLNDKPEPPSDLKFSVSESGNEEFTQAIE